MKLLSYYLSRFTIALTASASVLFAQETTTDAVDSFFKGIAPEGKIILNSRLRYETVEQQGFSDDAEALTFRTRLGYATADYSGFQLLVEGEFIRYLVDDFNAAGRIAKNRDLPIIADPEATELNRLWVSYKTEDGMLFKLGRQIIALDDQRFIGHVGWRQNIQTYDAATVEGSVHGSVAFHYSYIDKVHRVFGEDWPDHAGPIGEFDSDSHILNLSVSKTPLGKITGFAYFIGLDEAPVASSKTFGLSIKGSWSTEGSASKIAYAASVATQSEYADNPNEYQALYLSGDLSYIYKAFSIGAGYELLGSDDGVSFSTPLATLHKFNGWADVFLTTPGAGLQDKYISLSYKIPVGNGLVAKSFYHKFDSDIGSIDLGSEFDFLLVYKFSKYLSTTLKYADFDQGDTGTAGSRQKLSIQLDFVY